MSEKLKIGLFGFGCVGQGFYNILQQSKHVNAEIIKIGIKDTHKKRNLPDSIFTLSKDAILQDDRVNIIVELINDPEEAFTIVKKALKKGLPVVTANKKMVADHLAELIDLQQSYGGVLLYEASSCGSIPIINLLDRYFNNEQIKGIKGIFNGSSNYILSKIFNDSLSYDLALRQAQELGFAEKDPALDVGGFDALNKLCIIAAHAFGVNLRPSEVFNFGIENIRQQDINYAREKHLKIKSLAAITLDASGRLFPLVIPTFVSRKEELYDVEDELNAVCIESTFSGTHMLKGKGAGAYPTGLAVLSDVHAIASGVRYAYRGEVSPPISLNHDFDIEVYIRYDSEDLLNLLEIKPLEKQFWQDEKSVIAKVNIKKLIRYKELLVSSGIFIAAAPGSLEKIGDQIIIPEKEFQAVQY